MKRLCIFDFDGTLFLTPKPEEGKKKWKLIKGVDYEHKGWWGRKESLDTNVFNIKPYPKVLSILQKEKNLPDTSVVILTSRMEKLRPEIENILRLNNIVVDDVLLKSGRKDKGDVIMEIVKYNPDLEEIIVYDDFMEGDAGKLAEYTKIKELLPQKIKYELYFVDKGNVSLIESPANILRRIINEEIYENSKI